MKCADEFQQLRDGLWFWQVYEPAVKTELSCCAVALSGRLVFIDPIPLADEALTLLENFAPPSAIILTSGNHARGALPLREKFDIPICAHAEAQPEIEFPLNRVLTDGSVLLGELTVITLPGFGPGEIALWHKGLRALFVGDALINIGSQGFTQLPAKYCANAKLGRRSLQKLLQFDFELMTFAHGLPIVSGAKARLENLLA